LIVRSSEELDLLDQMKVKEFFENERPEFVFFTAAKVGGVKAMVDEPAEFLYENLQIEANVIHFSFVYGVKKLLNIASANVYSEIGTSPLKEKDLLFGLINEAYMPYSLAKIAGIKMCYYYRIQYNVNFISLVPCNLYGPGDRFDIEKGTVVASLISKFHDAKVKSKNSVTIWGDGKQLRELMFVEDFANIAVFLMDVYNEVEHINVGTGSEISIRFLAELIANIIGYEGNIEYNLSKPIGSLSKMLDNDKLSTLGWTKFTILEDGLKLTYDWYLNNHLV
jgi:GDP-L-fucose synthase